MNNNTVFRVKENDLVLNVSKDVNSEVWDESKYYSFIDELVGSRDYQREAILTALRFMCSGEYSNIKDLAQKNYESNESLRNAYTTFENYQSKISFNNSFNSSIDLATGTGKSWVMYGIAAIMLSEKVVDQVLVLTPSVTIEDELTSKFKTFACTDSLNTALNSVPPRIINGSESIVNGCICIENRDAIYSNTRSSIIDSLQNKGERTLVLCDEVHHVYYSEENNWKAFIENIGFKYIVGLSGTCYYKDNSYFTNVIYRYSLKKAIEDRRVKMVEYVTDGNIPTRNEDKWKVILKSHDDIKNKLKILPLTLVVTADVTACKRIAEDFKCFLEKNYNISRDEVNEKVLVIHSKSDAAGDRLRLKSVDKGNSKVEWIFSVSMLTEGWDVKRVFQIVPHEERAFNSKLLISQVMGRGLRVPLNWNYQDLGDPKVIIFNHTNWALSVKKLVDEVLEIEKKLSNTIVENSDYNFELLNVSYKAEKKVSKAKKEGTYKLFERGYIVLPTDSEFETVSANFIDISNNNAREWSAIINHDTYSIEDMARIMWYRFEDVPDDNNEGLCEKYQKEWPIEKLEKMIKKSLEKSNNTKITENLKQKFLSAMGVIFRQGNAFVDYNNIPDVYEEISTKKLRRDTVSASSLKKEKVIFWTSDTDKYLTIEEKEFFSEVKDTTNAYKQYEIRNKYDLKTPQSFVIADSDPEKEFLKKLTETHNNEIKGWIKSNSVGFYGIDYSWKKGEHTQRGIFNPDFFIKYKNRIIVVEIKGDEQISNPEIENIAKYKAACEHFKFINQKLKKDKTDLRYKFTMITPKSYEVFFNSFNSNNIEDIDGFISRLDAAIEVM